MSKTLSPKLAEKEKRNKAILAEFKDRSESGDMTMGIAEDIKDRFAGKISVSTILRIVRESGYFENKNANKFASNK